MDSFGFSNFGRDKPANSSVRKNSCYLPKVPCHWWLIWIARFEVLASHFCIYSLCDSLESGIQSQPISSYPLTWILSWMSRKTNQKSDHDAKSKKMGHLFLFPVSAPINACTARASMPGERVCMEADVFQIKPRTCSIPNTSYPMLIFVFLCHQGWQLV